MVCLDACLVLCSRLGLLSVCPGCPALDEKLSIFALFDEVDVNSDGSCHAVAAAPTATARRLPWRTKFSSILPHDVYAAANAAAGRFLGCS